MPMKIKTSNSELLLAKVNLIGNTQVGKTALTRRFTNQQVEKDYKQTDFVDCTIKSIGNMSFELWDIAGKLGFAGTETASGKPIADRETIVASFLDVAYSTVDIFCICVDLTKTQEEIEKDIQKYYGLINKHPHHRRFTLMERKVIVVGCKSDELDKKELSQKKAVLENEARKIEGTSVCTQSFGDNDKVIQSTAAFEAALIDAVKHVPTRDGKSFQIINEPPVKRARSREKSVFSLHNKKNDWRTPPASDAQIQTIKDTEANWLANFDQNDTPDDLTA